MSNALVVATRRLPSKTGRRAGAIGASSYLCPALLTTEFVLLCFHRDSWNSGWDPRGVPLKVGEIWILEESLNESLRERAAHFSGRDVPTEVGSRNRFPLPSASSAQSAVQTPLRIGKRAGSGLAAKRRKRRKKDRGSELCLHGFKAGLQFCSVGRIGPSPAPLAAIAFRGSNPPRGSVLQSRRRGFHAQGGERAHYPRTGMPDPHLGILPS